MTLRVLHIGKFFPPHHGGMEVFLADLVQAQRAQGMRDDLHLADLAFDNQLPHRAMPARRGVYLLCQPWIDHSAIGLASTE